MGRGLAGDAFFAELGRRLAARERAALSASGLEPSSVLVPLFEGQDGRPRLVLTRRPDNLRTHAGQVAFPGGRRDAGDPDDLATALREAEEELGISRSAVSVLGALDDVWVVTGFRLTPFVARIPRGLELRPNPREVARVFDVGLDELADPACTKLRIERMVRQGRALEVPFFEHGGEVIWGATGRAVLQLLEVALGFAGPAPGTPPS